VGGISHEAHLTSRFYRVELGSTQIKMVSESIQDPLDHSLLGYSVWLHMFSPEREGGVCVKSHILDET
jgi:hypothetical protein